MNGSTFARRSTAVAAAATAAVFLVGLGLTGCAGGDAEAKPKATDAAFDQELHDALPAEVKDAGKVTVAVTPTYPPYEFLAEDGKTVIGQNADVLTELGKLLGIEFEYERVNEFGSILSGIQAGRYDTAVIFGDTLERQEAVDILSFYNDGLSFVGSKDLPKGDEEVCGKTAGLGQGSTADLVAEDISKMVCTDNGLDPIEFKRFSNTDLTFVALDSGQIDLAFVSDGTVASLVEKSGDKLAKVSETLFALKPTGLPFSKDDRELAEAMEAGLQQLIDDGTMLEILKKWKTEGEFSDTAAINAVKAP